MSRVVEERVCGVCDTREFVDGSDESWTRVYTRALVTVELCRRCTPNPSSPKFAQAVDAAVAKGK